MSAIPDTLVTVVETTDTKLILTRICGIALGAVLGLIYICFAWYTNDQKSKNISVSRRFTSLVALLASTGIIYVVGCSFPNPETFRIWCITATCSSIAIAVAILLICGAICGYSITPDKRKVFRISIQYAIKCAFEGWKDFNEAIEQAELNIHVQSKQALAMFAYELHEAIAYTKVGGKDRNTFVRYFKSVAAHALYNFFQHSRDQHPDYCACYFKWDILKKQLTVVASVSGSDVYATNDNIILGEGSLAHRAIIEGRHYVWPENKKGATGKKLIPAVRNGIKRFIAIPVYKPSMPKDETTCLGVLCVDSSKEGHHFFDKYHVDILQLLASAIGELDQTLL